MQLETRRKQPSYENTLVYPSVETAKKRFAFSHKEITHLAVAVLLVISVGLNLQGMVYNDSGVLALLSVMFAVSFLAHELAHKTMAQRHGLWAEFRLTLIGAMLTLLSVISPIIKIIAPGAVMVSGSADKKVIGKTSIIGPTANIFLASIMCAASVALMHNWTFPVIAFYNAWLAIFNLIPIGILDGFKVFVWNKRIWALAFTASVVVGVISYRLLF